MSMDFDSSKNIGLVLLGVAALIIAYSYFLRTNAYVENLKKPSEKSEATNVADYQLVQLGSSRRDQFLLDKTNGRIWTSVCAGSFVGIECVGDYVWQEQMVVGLNGYTREDLASYLKYLSADQNSKTPSK